MNISDLIYQHYDKLNETDLQIWQYVSNHIHECQTQSIQEVALACNVAPSSIIRLTQKIGLEGFSELKFLLKWSERNDNVKLDFIPDIASELKATVDQLAAQDMSPIVAALASCNRVHIFATGDVQAHVALEFKRDFTRQNKLMNIIEGSSELDSILSNIYPNDMFVIISFSGNNPLAVTLAKYLAKIDITTLSIALAAECELKKLSTYYLAATSTSYQLPRNIKGTCPTHLFLIEQFLYLNYVHAKAKHLLDK